MLNYIFGLFSHDIAIDLGTANTLVWVKGTAIGGRLLGLGKEKRVNGIVIREPSVVARHKKTKKILAIGTPAKKMIGKTPATVEAFRPLRDGVIADFDAASGMLSYYIKKVHYRPHAFIQPVPRPRVIVGIPSGVTEVERRAVWEAALEAGAREAFLIEEPMAAAIGGGLPVEESKGSMVVDIGGGTTEIAVISLGGIVVNRSIRIAGDELDEVIVNFVRLKHALLIGQPTAEEIKIAIGSAYHGTLAADIKTVVRGRSLESGLPKSLRLGAGEIREAISGIVNRIIASISEVIEETPPELIGDIMENGLLLAGGGALIAGIDQLIASEVKMPVRIAKDPQTSVVRGAAALLNNARLLERVRVTGGLQ